METGNTSCVCDFVVQILGPFLGGGGGEGRLEVLFFFYRPYCQLRARRALLQLKDVPLRTRRVLLLYKVNGDSALLVLNGTSLICNSALLALSWRYHVQVCMVFCFCFCVSCNEQMTLHFIIFYTSIYSKRKTAEFTFHVLTKWMIFI